MNFRLTIIFRNGHKIDVDAKNYDIRYKGTKLDYFYINATSPNNVEHIDVDEIIFINVERLQS